MPAKIPAEKSVDPLSASPTKWVKQIQAIRKQKSTNCLSVFDHFVGLALKFLNSGKSNINNVSLRIWTNSSIQYVLVEKRKLILCRIVV